MGDEARDIIWSKLQVLRAEYFEELMDLAKALNKKLNQVTQTDEVPPMQYAEGDKVQHMFSVISRMIPYLTVPKEKLPETFDSETLAKFEKQLKDIVEVVRRSRKRGEAGEKGQLFSDITKLSL